jgi:hypothetical protein
MSDLGLENKNFKWTKGIDDVVELPINVITGGGLTMPPPVTLRMAIHPFWIEQMDSIDVGDLVTTHTGEVGIVTKVLPMTELKVKRVEVLIGAKREIYFSMSLKKIEDEK